MNEESAGSEKFLAELIEKRDKLNALIAAVMEHLGLGESPTGSEMVAGLPKPPLSVNRQQLQSQSVESDSFFGLGIYDATLKFLRMTKKKQSTNAIVAALEAGGFTHASSNFGDTVRSVLGRELKRGELARVGPGEWGLSEWYPGAKSSKLMGTKKPPSKAKKSKKKKAEKTVKPQPAKPAAAAPKEGGGGKPKEPKKQEEETPKASE